MRKKFLVVLVVLSLCAGTTLGQFGSGIVYDPTNYHNALLRYYQLQQQLIQLRSAYNLALQMSRNLQNMRSRYRAEFSQWRGTSALDTYGNASGWVNGANSGQAVLPGYQRSTTQLGTYNQVALSDMTDEELRRVQSQYASVELADGANANAIATIGFIRGNAAALETQIGNLEQDSFSDDAALNSEVQVLNKINATNVLTLRSIQDSNKLLAGLLEQQTIALKQQREATTNAINADISRRATLAGNLTQVTGSLTDSLQNFRMP
jgi:hypothetical protein